MADWEKTFVLAVSRERAWACFTDPGERSAWMAMPDEGSDDHFTTAGGTPGWTLVVDEVVPQQRLRWSEKHTEPEGTIEVCVVFEDADSGTRITMTQSRFGSILDTHWEASRRGWNEAIADLAFYLRTGIPARRHFAWRGATGIMCHEVLEGVEVATVFPGGFGEAAGLKVGDLLLDVAGAPIFSMAELWTIVREHQPGDVIPIRYVRGTELLSGEAALSSAADFPQ